MNQNQKRALIAGLGVVVLMGLIPPWNYTYQDRVKPAGYAWLFSPTYQGRSAPPLSRLLGQPQPESPKPRFKIKESPPWSVKMDGSRLLIQWLVTLMVTAGLWVALKRK